MRLFLFSLFLVLFIACNNSTNITESGTADSGANQVQKDSSSKYVYAFTDTALEKKITAALLKLPFVIKSNNYIDSVSDHKKGIAFLLENPGNEDPGISVQAGYNGNERFETYYRFFVDPVTLAILVYDPVENKKLTVNEYLKTQK